MCQTTWVLKIKSEQLKTDRTHSADAMAPLVGFTWRAVVSLASQALGPARLVACLVGLFGRLASDDVVSGRRQNVLQQCQYSPVNTRPCKQVGSFVLSTRSKQNSEHPNPTRNKLIRVTESWLESDPNLIFRYLSRKFYEKSRVIRVHPISTQICDMLIRSGKNLNHTGWSEFDPTRICQTHT